MTAAARPVAAFDFDGTITQRDTLLGFLAFVGGRGVVAKALLRHGAGLIKGVRDDDARDAAKERVLGDVLRGRHESDVIAAGERYAEQLPKGFRDGAVEQINWHRDEGHELVIVSASLVYYLRPIASSLGFDDVIGVEMQLDADGLITGALARPNVRAEQKAIRLCEWFGDRPATELWAYGNSSGDDALLAMADHPIWCGKRASRNPS